MSELHLGSWMSLFRKNVFIQPRRPHSILNFTTHTHTRGKNMSYFRIFQFLVPAKLMTPKEKKVGSILKKKMSKYIKALLIVICSLWDFVLRPRVCVNRPLDATGKATANLPRPNRKIRDNRPVIKKGIPESGHLPYRTTPPPFIASCERPTLFCCLSGSQQQLVY